MNFDWTYVSSGAPYITISPLGVSLNAAVLSSLGNPKKLLLGYDPDALAIGVKPYEGEEGVKPYDISGRVKNGWVKIGCKDFIAFLSTKAGITFKPARKYMAIKDSHTNVLYIKLVNKEG